MEGPHAHAMLKQDIENEITNMQEELSESTKSEQLSAESKAAAEKDIAVEEKGLAEDTQYLGDENRGCQPRAPQFDEDVRAQALRHVEQVSCKSNSTMLGALAYRASADPFVKVRAVFEDMDAAHRVQVLQV